MESGEIEHLPKLYNAFQGEGECGQSNLVYPSCLVVSTACCTHPTPQHTYPHHVHFEAFFARFCELSLYLFSHSFILLRHLDYWSYWMPFHYFLLIFI